jgi:hypothetical protein
MNMSAQRWQRRKDIEMGMDVYGKAPKANEGEYFRNNVWWWRPLWDYCCDVATDIIGEELAENGHYNSGEGLNAEAAERLGNRLKDEIYSGRTYQYQQDYNEHLSKLSRHACKFCEGTGIRTDAVGVEMGMPTRKLTEEEQILLERDAGWCNACRGEGLVDDFNTNYPFTVENVDNFAMFLLNCGGFQIC